VNEKEQERFEAELRRIQPASAPDQLVSRLRAAKPCPEPRPFTHHQRTEAASSWWRAWRWLAPALAAVVAGLLVARANFRSGSVGKAPVAATYGFKANDVQVNQQLVTSFDVVAKLPGGEPVRFHCQKWNDQVMVTDTNRGTEIVEDNPRIEVVPVRFETY
jgi:hypothetical protein